MNEPSPVQSPSRRWEYAALVILVAAFTGAGVMRLNDLSLYTDSTRYLIWANSLAEANGFLDATSPVPTRFVMNAPMYPLLLAPSQLVAPWSMEAAKIWTLLWGALAVVLMFFWMRRSFSALPSLGGAAFLAVHPLFFVVSTEVLSEAPFMALVLLLLLAVDPFLSSRGRNGWVIAAAAILVLLPLLREVAIAFALAAAVVLGYGGRWRHAAWLLGTAAVLVVAWNVRNALSLPDLQAGQEPNIEYLFGHFVTPQGQSLVNEFVTRLWLNARGYFGTVAGSIFHPFPSSLVHAPSALYILLQDSIHFGKVIVLVAAFGLLIHGILLDVEKPGVGLFKPLSALFFMLIVLVYPVHELRFLLPVLPLVLFFLIRSLTVLAQRVFVRRRVRTAATAAFAVFVIFPNVVAVTELVRSSIRYSRSPETFAREVFESGDPSPFYTRPWSRMGAWIVEHLPEGSVIASPAKEIAPFVRGMAVQELSRTAPGPLFDRSLRNNAVDVLLATTVWADFRAYEFVMDESRRFSFEVLHSSGTLTLFRVNREFAPASSPPRETNGDTASYTASELLRRGRRHFLRLEYIEALGSLNEAARLAPAQAEIVAQQILASSVLGDVPRSQELFERLFTLPQSTPHVALAQAHLRLAEQLKVASEATSSEERSALAVGAGRGYWDLGYPLLALRVMQNVLRLDSLAFDAALWACHFARQTGDTALSQRYLSRLKDIDITAPILTDLEAIDRAGTALSRARQSHERVGLLLQLASVYEKLELYQEAVDDLERARAIDPLNPEVRSSMTRIYDRTGALPALRKLQSE